jgi:hypothetical protein
MSVIPLARFSTVQLHAWIFKTHACATERHGRLFFEICWLLAAFKQEKDAKAIGKKWRQSWESMLQRRGFDATHFLVPYNSKTGNERYNQGMCSDQYALSTPAVLHFMVHLTQWFDSDNTVGLLDAFLEEFLPSGTTLNFKVVGQDIAVTVQEQLQKLAVSAKDFKQAIFSRERGWKLPKISGLESALVPLHTLFRALEGANNSEKLYMALLHAAGDRIAAQILGTFVQPSCADSIAGEISNRLQAKLARTQSQKNLETVSNLAKKRKGSDQDLPNTVYKKTSRQSWMKQALHMTGTSTGWLLDGHWSIANTCAWWMTTPLLEASTGWSVQ